MGLMSPNGGHRIQGQLSGKEVFINKCCIYICLRDPHCLEIAETALVHELFSQAK